MSEQQRKKGKGRGRGTEKARTSSSLARPVSSASQEPFGHEQPAVLAVPGARRGRGQRQTTLEKTLTQVAPKPGPSEVELPLERPSTSIAVLPEPVHESVFQPIRSATSSLQPSELNEYKPICRPKDSNGNFKVCTLGQQISVRTNHFQIDIQKGKGFIYVYDIDITPACNKFKKRQLMHMAWYDPKNYFLVESPTKKIPGYGFDGNKNLYTSIRLCSIVGKEIKIPWEEKSLFTIKVNKETAIRNLGDIMNPSIPDETKDSIIAALDIILLTRAKAEHGASLKRSFYFQPSNPTFISGDTKEIWAGFYASARLGQWTLTLNADVTASVVIASMTFNSIYDYYRGNVSDMDKYLKALKKDVKVLIEFGNPAKKMSKQVRTFERVISLTAKSYQFEHNGKKVTPLQYFNAEYGVQLQFPDRPLVQIKSTKQNVYYPMEFCSVAPGQFSLGKLESFEQSELVKYVTMKPQERYRKTTDDLKAKFATHEQVELLKDFGITLSTTPMTVNARVLPPVTVQAKQKGNPVDLKCNNQAAFFLGANCFYNSPSQVGTWAVVVTVRKTFQVDEWVDRFRNTLLRKGINCGPPAFKLDAFSPDGIKKAFEQFRTNNVLFGLFFVEKGGPLYATIKQNGDREYKIVTQCVDAFNRRNKDQSYLENLILKVNVKLGGINHVLSSKTFKDQGLKPMFDEDVLLVGADVTHPGIGELSKPSIAAVVGSIDRQASKYVAVVTPQARTPKVGEVCTQEWISDFANAMKSLLKAYFRNTKQKPKKIIVYRDGVSEGQYTTVLQKELTQIQKACRELEATYEPAITYIVVRKRIKTKFYAEERNQMNNVPAGTLVELDITQPLRYFDCFMVPHHSLLGTARPSHYVVLYDDSHFSPNDLAYLSFCLCHLFPRCTKAVSLPAPVYHAHLAADRANQHLAGKPLSASQSRRPATPEEERKLAMDHAKDATIMDIENTLPNYWL